MDFTGIESHYSGTYSALCIKLPTQINISEQEHVKKFAFLKIKFFLCSETVKICKSISRIIFKVSL